MIRPLLLLACLCACPTLSARSTATAAPATATDARQALDAWLAAFNKGDRATWEAFRQRYGSAMNIDNLLEFRDSIGGFVLARREPAEGDTAAALLRERESDQHARLRVTLAPGPTARIDLAGVPTPPDLKPARLDAQAALDDVAAFADAASTKDAFAGALLIAQGDQVLLQGAWGLADRTTGARNTLDTRFRLGSMNKMLTSVAILQLVQAGKVSLDGTLGDYLTAYPNADMRRATVRQLLSHRAGAGDIFGPEFDRERERLRTHADYLALFGTRAPAHPPGSRHDYANYGFVLLGAIIEAVSGQDYYAYVEEHILIPAGMRDTGSLPESDDMPRRARAYMRTRGQWRDAAHTLPWRGTAAGGGYSTVGDLLRFARALQGGRLVDPTLLAIATRPDDAGYGLGFTADELEGLPWYGHGGGAAGMNTEFRVFPTLDRVVISLANVDPPVAQRLVDRYLARMPLE
ncbi:serine hydrolase domain-containing protein [Pseudoxanthomonas sp. F11]|uniref:serine hydrolase domain-containing protein n=1 Tax=Pseudoxanthomonas sp. F11 TaxID=3126308 RepID=UPI00300DAD21